MIKNKKAMGEKILSIWMFIIWFFILVAIVASILIFASDSADVREFQASVMKNRILDCLNKNFAKSTDFSFDIYKECRFSKKIVEENIYFNIIIKKFETEEVVKTISGGNKEFVTYCELQKINDEYGKETESKNFPKCFFSESNSYDPNFGRYRVEITVASNNIGGRI